MEKIFLLVLLINSVLLIVLIFNLYKNKNEEALKVRFSFSDEFRNISSQLSNTNEKILKEFLEFKRDTSNSILKSSKENIDTVFNFNYKLREELNYEFKNLSSIIEKRLDKINNDVEIKLDKSFDTTRKTFSNVMESLGRLDEAQKKMEILTNNVQNLNNVLNDKKTRGIFGEVQLYQIMNSIFGENDEIYRKQHKLKNGYIADLVLFAPEPLGTICIDSKFPMENYRRIIDSFDNKVENEKQFFNDLKKHIDDISLKYIVSGETSNQAILFLPAEAIFSYINSYHTKIVEYAYDKKVWIASPTTMMAILTTIQAILQNIKQSEYAIEIQNELNLLSVEFERYENRWNTLEKDINKLTKDVKDISNTSSKISKKFDNIKNVDIKK